MKIFNILFPFSDFLYLLQLEEYASQRYLKLLPKFFFRRNFQKRQKLVYTQRVQATLALSVFLTILFSFVIFVFSLLLIPVWVFMANFILNPFYEEIKAKIQERAASYFQENFQGKVIAIAGSYGKTTTKNYIYELVKYNYKTQLVPGNINTPTGIANWVLTNLKKGTEILIVEMDTYYREEIERSCAVTPPDIAILTNVGDQHLERFKTKENLKIALNEIFEYAKPRAIKIKGLDNNLDYALEVAKVLEIPEDIIKDTIKKLKKPDRRGNIINMHGFNTIDESYNISFTTAKFALENALSLAKKEKKKLLVITGGIPELGEENKTANIDYGKILQERADNVIVLKTVLYKDILKGLKKNYILAESMEHAWEIITNEFSPEDYIVLMQPELGDNYY